MNVFQEIDRTIWKFSNRLGHKALLDRCGSFSTPLRGGVFGKYTQREVLEELAIRGVDVLLLGANPNTGDHQDERTRMKRRTLLDHIETGMVSEQYWDESGGARPGWSWESKSHRGWQIYRRMLAGITSLDHVAMGNFIPWGSRRLDLLLCDINQGRIDRAAMIGALALCDELVAKLTSTLKPKVVMVATSITNERKLNKLYETRFLRNRYECEERTVPRHRPGTSFTFYIGDMEFDGHVARVIHTYHPEACRYVSNADLDLILPELGKVIGTALRT